MKTTTLVASALIALIATSCSKGESDTPTGKKDGYIHVNSSIVSTHTKAVVGKDSELKGITFLRKDDTKPSETTLDFSGVTAFSGDRLSGDNGGVIFNPSQVYDNTSDKTAYIMGMHPSVTPKDGKVTWVIDGTTDVLITNVWNAGRYSAPVEAGMTFQHALARVEVVVQGETGVSSDVIKANWGQITAVSVETLPTLELDLKTVTATASGTAQDIAMTKGITYKDALTASDIPANGSTAILCGAIVAPQASKDVKIKVTTKRGNEAEVVTTINVTLAGDLAKSRVHTITLSFSGADKSVNVTSSSIGEWTEGEKGNSGLMPPTILEYGVAPFDRTDDLVGSVQSTYNGLYGEGEITNGDYRTTAELAYANEKPYYKFEVAKFDAPIANWRVSQGTAIDKSDNICVKTHGEGWRMPRISELRLIMLNRSALVESGAGFTALTGTHYFSATEYGATQSWYYSSSNGIISFTTKTANTVSVRCIREIQTLTVLEYGVAPFNLTGDVSYGSTTNSYNGLYGEGETTNGAYRTIDTYAQERPYHKFEVAKTDAYLSSSNTKDWKMLQGTAADKSDNICVQTHGKGWRMPRASELILIALNRNALVESGAGFTALTGTYYISATEKGSTQALFMKNSDNTLLDGNKTSRTVNLRCIRELP